MHRSIAIASRGSELALWQAESVRTRLVHAHPGIQVRIEIVRTIGDRILDLPLARIGDRGLFTRELDEALLDGRADIAVHSLKDIPTRIPDGLALAAVSEREDPRDVLLGRRDVETSIESLPPGARVGTSSLRRRSQLRAVRPDLEVVDLRGNLNTRLAKLDAGEYDAILLAAAGVIRLGWLDRISQYLPFEQWLPAVGQGALGIVGRVEDETLAPLLESVHDPVTAAHVTAERSFLRDLEGGCQVPIGALATSEGDDLTLRGLVADTEGHSILRHDETGPAAAAEEIGRSLARTLLAHGAGSILRQVREEAATPGISAP